MKPTQRLRRIFRKAIALGKLCANSSTSSSRQEPTALQRLQQIFATAMKSLKSWPTQTNSRRISLAGSLRSSIHGWLSSLPSLPQISAEANSRSISASHSSRSRAAPHSKCAENSKT
ncbi:MAG: hypothetical protein SGPRY_006240, partial [Prymnesium sp.]